MSHFNELIEVVPQQSIRQDGLIAELVDLQIAALRLGMAEAGEALQKLIEGRAVASLDDFTPVATLPAERLIVEVLFDGGFVGFSWREGADATLGSDAFDENHGKVIGWRNLRPLQMPDEETIRMHANMLSRKFA